MEQRLQERRFQLRMWNLVDFPRPCLNLFEVKSFEALKKVLTRQGDPIGSSAALYQFITMVAFDSNIISALVYILQLLVLTSKANDDETISFTGTQLYAELLRELIGAHLRISASHVNCTQRTNLIFKWLIFNC